MNFKYKIGTIVTIKEPHLLESHLATTTTLSQNARHLIAYNKFRISGYTERLQTEYYYLCPITGDVFLTSYENDNRLFSNSYIFPVNKLSISNMDNWKLIVKRRG